MRRQPTISWQQVRQLAERWEWQDPRTGATVTGHNPPKGAKHTRRKPFYIKYVTKAGVLEQGIVTCLKVTSLVRHQRMVRFEASGAIRIVSDLLICEIDGFRVVAG